MDPDVLLDTIRELIEAWADGDEDPAILIRLADCVESLDNWMSGGGFLPKQWEILRESP